jgi:predicted NBD/HSP70 family sugar kinase
VRKSPIQDHSTVKENRPDHCATVLKLLRERGALQRSELARLTGLSPATLSRTMIQLRRAGFVSEATGLSSGPGRPPRRADLRPDGGHVVGIDAGGSMLRGVVADLNGRIVRRSARPARDPANADRLIDDLASLIRDVLGDQAGIRLIAIAAGISGIVDDRTGVVRMSPDLPGLNGVRVAARLEAELSIPVRVDNDDILAAIGETAAGAARGAANVVFLSLGYGLGAGILVDGRPLRGASHASGAVGFVGAQQLDERGSGRAIAERYAASMARTVPLARGRSARGIDARIVFERAQAGDGTARRVVADAVEAIAEMAVDVAAVVDPKVIVLGGGLAKSDRVLDAVTDRVEATLPFPPRVVRSALEDAAVVNGAVTLALGHDPLPIVATPAGARRSGRHRSRTAAAMPGTRRS